MAGRETPKISMGWSGKGQGGRSVGRCEGPGPAGANGLRQGVQWRSARTRHAGSYTLDRDLHHFQSAHLLSALVVKICSPGIFLTTLK